MSLFFSEFGFLDSVDFGGVAFSVGSAIPTSIESCRLPNGSLKSEIGSRIQIPTQVNTIVKTNLN